jgi:protein-tyrosine-phosphatase
VKPGKSLIQVILQLPVRVAQAIARRIRHWTVLRTARDHNRKAMAGAGPIHRVLVLCYGNIYRSPLVAHLMDEKSQLEDLQIRSAGFYDKTGRSCVDEYQQLLMHRGYDLSAHRSSRITQQDIQWAELIVIMDRKNWDRLYEMNAQALRKTVWIGGFSEHDSVEVADPYGRDERETQQVIDQLERHTQEILERIYLSRKT